MKDSIKYLIVKDKKKKNTTYFEYDENVGYNMTQNKKSKSIEGININKLIIINDNLIEKVIDKKIERRFKTLLELIASICESDEDPSSGLMFALNEIERFKRELINKYVSYMNDKQIKFLDKKIKLIEREVQTKMYQYNEIMIEKENIEEKKSQHHR